MNQSRRIELERVADTLRDECKVTGYGFNQIFESVAKIGYKLIRYPIGDSFLGLAMIKENDRLIFSNSSSILSREIFTVAHELGHQKLHLINGEDQLIKDDDFDERNEYEAEANYFAACLLMPMDKVEKFIRLELKGKKVANWTGLEIARIQNAFNVSYEMTLIRLKYLGVIDQTQFQYFQEEKMERSITKLLHAINGNVDLCSPTLAKQVPTEFLEWVIFNYNEKLIPIESLEKALDFVGLTAQDVTIGTTQEHSDCLE